MFTPGSDRGPFAAQKNLEPAEETQKQLEYGEKQLEHLNSLLAQWEKFRSSQLGKASVIIASVEVRRLRAALGATTKDFVDFCRGVLGYQPDKGIIDEMRAEIRGALAVWEKILFEPTLLVAKKSEFEQKLSGGKKTRKGPIEVKK